MSKRFGRNRRRLLEAHIQMLEDRCTAVDAENTKLRCTLSVLKHQFERLKPEVRIDYDAPMDLFKLSANVAMEVMKYTDRAKLLSVFSSLGRDIERSLFDHAMRLRKR